MAHVYVRSSASGTGTGADWTNAYTTLAAAMTAKAAGDVFWVAADHAETQASLMTLTPPGTVSSWNYVYCVTHTGAVPPVSADLRTTATITTTSNNSLLLAGGFCYFYGITFNAGTGSSAVAALNICSAPGHQVFENCTLNLVSTAANQQITFGSTANNPHRVDLIGSKLGFGGVTQWTSLRNVRLNWRNTASAINTAGAFVVPTTLFKVSVRASKAVLEGVDLSAAGTGKILFAANEDPSDFILKDCKLNTNVTMYTATTSGGPILYVSRSDATGTNYRTEKWAYEGAQTVETAIYRTGGASDGATPLSARVITSAGARWVNPFECLPITKWNATTASPVNVTVEGVWNSASLPNNDEVWFDVEYLGSVGSPLGSFSTGSKADNLAAGSALTESTQAWDAGVTARSDSIAYVAGDVIKVASNAGRIFFCTTAGTSAASEPGGYAAAIDGGSVADGTAVFRAGRRFKQTIAVTAQLVGSIYLYPKVAATSTTVYIDPKMAIA